MDKEQFSRMLGNELDEHFDWELVDLAAIVAAIWPRLIKDPPVES